MEIILIVALVCCFFVIRNLNNSVNDHKIEIRRLNKTSRGYYGYRHKRIPSDKRYM